MMNSFVRKEDLDKEFSVVLNEFEMNENSPTSVLMEHTMSAAYLWHSYGRSVVGNRADIERVPIDNLLAFYHKFYQPDNAVLTVAGKVDEFHVVNLVNGYFGKIPKPDRVLPATYTTEPPQDGMRSTSVHRVGDVQAILTMYHIPDGANADFPALEVLASILGEDRSGRLYKALVDTKKVSQVFSEAMQMNEPGIFINGALLSKTDSLDDVRKIILDTVDNLAKDPPTTAEVDRARTRLLKEVEMNLRNPERIGLFVSEEIAAGDWRLLYLDRDRVAKVTPGDVMRVAITYLKPSNLTIGEFVPEKEPARVEIPSKSNVAALVKDYKSTVVVETGEAFDPSPANIDAHTLRFALQNGMKISLLSKKTHGATVHASIALHFGDVESLKDKSEAAELAASTLIEGTSTKDRQQIQDEIDRLKSRLSIDGGPRGTNVSFETGRENLPGMIQLVAEILEHAALPASEIEQNRKRKITELEYESSEPDNQAYVALESALYPFPKGDVRRTMTPDEEIAELKAVSYDRVRAFYKDFYGASNAELSIVGDFDPVQIRPLVTKLFENWKSPSHYERVKMGFQKIEPVNLSLETPDKANASFMSAERLRISDSSSDYPALFLGNYMLGGGFLNSRLAQRIRVKEGLSYSISSMFYAASHEEESVFFANAIAAPQNISKVESAFTQEIARVLRDGFTQQEMDADRDGWLQSRQVSRAEDVLLCIMLNNHALDGRMLAWDQALEDKVKALTPDQVLQALKRNLDPTVLVTVKAGDFKMTAATTAP
jgi:zinc protease